MNLCFGFGFFKQFSLSWPGTGVLQFARAELWDRGSEGRDGSTEAMPVIGWLRSCYCPKLLQSFLTGPTLIKAASGI